MDIEELVFLIFELLNEYIKDKIYIDEDYWIQPEILKILNNNLGIDFYQFFIFLTQCLDKIVYNRIKQDANIETNLSYKNKFQIRLFARKINNKILKKVKIN